jgi:hypothetical protein
MRLREDSACAYSHDMRWISKIGSLFKLQDPGSDEAYAAAVHEFPTAMGVPVPTGLSQAEYKKQNDEYLSEAAKHRLMR